MEVLNNIWSVLTTENETTYNIVTAIVMFIEIYLSFCLFTQILKINYTKFQKINYVILVSIFGIINSLIVPRPFNIFLNYIVLFIFIKYLFKTNILKTIFAVIIPLIIFGLVNSLIMNPFIKLLNINLEGLLLIPIYRIIYLSITYLIIYFLVLLIRHTDFKLTFSMDLDKKTTTNIFLNLILGISTFLIQVTLNFYYINEVPIIFTLFNFILLFAYFFYSFYSLIKTTKLDVATRDLETAESYNNSLTVLYDNVKGFKHDFDNMVNTIGGYIKVDDMEGLKEYYSSLEKECEQVKNVQMLNPKVINNPGIYNLLVSKYQKATDSDIKINFEFFFDFDNLQMPIYPFSRILGILLDNAIEAAKDCEEKEINILFRESRKQHVQIISIENTYMDKNIDTKKIFEKGVSGKKEHTGIGLWEVNEIVKKNNNIVLNTTKNDKYFKQELQIYF